MILGGTHPHFMTNLDSLWENEGNDFLHMHIAFLLSLFFLQVIQNDGYENGSSSTKKKGKRANGKQEKKRR